MILLNKGNHAQYLMNRYCILYTYMYPYMYHTCTHYTRLFHERTQYIPINVHLNYMVQFDFMMLFNYVHMKRNTWFVDAHVLILN